MRTLSAAECSLVRTNVGGSGRGRVGAKPTRAALGAEKGSRACRDGICRVQLDTSFPLSRKSVQGRYISGDTDST